MDLTTPDHQHAPILVAALQLGKERHGRDTSACPPFPGLREVAAEAGLRYRHRLPVLAAVCDRVDGNLPGASVHLGRQDGEAGLKLHGVREARYAPSATMSSLVNLATDSFIN